MSQSIPDSIVDRIRKLLALSKHNDNEHEAASAAARAQKLMAEYNLEISQVSDAPAAQETTREKRAGMMAATSDWQVALMGTLAKNYFCMHWTETVLDVRLDGKGKMRNRRRHSLIGRAVNILLVSEMYEYLTSTMDRLCPYEDTRARAAKSWFMGCSDRLRSRLDEQRATQEAESRAQRDEPNRGSGSDLVLSDVYSSEADLNNDVRYGYTAGTTAARKAQSKADMAAYMAKHHPDDYTTPAAPASTETPTERAKREKQEQRASERWYARYNRELERAEARIDRRAYHQGSEQGRDIGLDKQVEVNSVPAIR